MHTRATRLVRVALVLTALLPGCAAPGGVSFTEHLLDTRHFWHGYPSRAGLVIGCLPLLPLAALEGAFTGTSPFAIENPGFFGGCGLVLGMGVAHVVGIPFYVLGLPFEPSTEETGAPDASRRPSSAEPQPVDQSPNGTTGCSR